MWAAITGLYSQFTLQADSSFTYAVDNGNPTINALASGQSFSDVFTYQITDGNGDPIGSLTVDSDGNYIFTPASGYTGPVPPILFAVDGGSGDLSTGALVIKVPDLIVDVVVPPDQTSTGDLTPDPTDTVSQIQVDVDGDGDLETIVMPPDGITQNLTDPEGRPVGSLTGAGRYVHLCTGTGLTGPVPPILFTVEHDNGSLSAGLISMNVQSLDIPDPLPGLPVLPPLHSLAQPPQDGDDDIIDGLNDGRGNASGTNDTQAVTGVLLNMLLELSGRASTSLTGPGVVLQGIEGTASLQSIDVVHLGDRSLGLLSDAFADTRYATNPLAVRPHEITSSNRVDGLWLQLQSDRLRK